MVADTLEDVFSKHGVSAVISSAILAEGWTLETFRFAAVDSSQFETVLPDLLNGNDAPLLQKACLRSAFL